MRHAAKTRSSGAPSSPSSPLLPLMRRYFLQCQKITHATPHPRDDARQRGVPTITNLLCHAGAPPGSPCERLAISEYPARRPRSAPTSLFHKHASASIPRCSQSKEERRPPPTIDIRGTTASAPSSRQEPSNADEAPLGDYKEGLRSIFTDLLCHAGAPPGSPCERLAISKSPARRPRSATPLHSYTATRLHG